MERGVLQSPSVQQIMGGSPSWWDMNIPRTSPQQASHPLTSPSSSSSALNQYPPSNFLPMASGLDDQELPMSWSQLLMEGLEERDDDRCSPTLFQPLRVEEGWDDQVLYRSGIADKDHVKQEISGSGGYVYGHRNEEFLETWPSWNQILPTLSSSSSLSSSMFDFANRKAERRNHQLNHSSEFNSTSKGSSFKKARVQASSIFQVRREKLGDKITALHQIVSPFGKTDTASVLLEAIGYIKFLQSQIEALSSPRLASELGNMMPSSLDDTHMMKRRGLSDQGCDDEPKKGLRSRGLCLVPLSLILKVGSKNIDYCGSDFTECFSLGS